MRHSMAQRNFTIMFALVIMTLFTWTIHGLPEVQAIKPQPLVAAQDRLKPRQTSSQMNPSNILWPPDCATKDSHCLDQSAVKSCTVKDCSKMVALTCWNHVYYIDFSCLCKSLSSSTCPSCSSGINKELYLAWLASYCPLDPGWNGLPSNWAGVPEYKILEAGEVNAVTSVDSYHPQTENPFTSQFITDKHTIIDDHHLPSCTSNCQWLNSRWNASFVDGNVEVGLAGANVFQPTYKIGGVPQSGKLYVDLSVFCPGWKWSDLQSNCSKLCNTDLEPTSLLLWLNTTCGQVPGFTGLPDHWTDSLALINNTFSNSSFPGPSCSQASSDSGCQITSTISSCTRELCDGVDVNGNCQAEYLVNLPCFCSQVKYSSCIESSGSCSSSMQETGLLLWMNNTCGSVSGFPGMPSNWTKSLNIGNSSYLKVDSFLWPNCLTAGHYSDCQLNSVESSCTRTFCNATDGHGDCASATMVDMACFCSDVKYGDNCTSNCGLAWERAQYLNWLNNTCTPIGHVSNLPGNWTSLLLVQRSEMLPGSWDLTPNTTDIISKPYSPSNSSKLLVFASANFAMLVLVPLLGRRTTIKFLTFGFFGHQDAGSWYYTGPAAVVLHVASNAINAAIVKSVPGFEHTSITALTFFWCTRPRITWLIVVLLPYQKQKSMYFAAAASTFFSEGILQIIGAYYTGSALNYARRQKFLEGHLSGTSYARQARIMYAGALFWLILVPFAIAALAWSVWEISKEIKRLGKGWTQCKKLVKENCDIALEQVKLLKTAHSNMKPIGAVPWQKQVEPLQSHARASLQGVIQQWNELATAWKDTSIRIRREQNKRQREKQRKQRYEVQLTKVLEETEKYRQLYRDSVVLDQKIEEGSHKWRLTVERKQEEAHAHQVDATRRIALVQEQRAEVTTLLDESINSLRLFEDRIEQEETRIAADNEDLKSMRWQERNWLGGRLSKISDRDSEYADVSQRRQTHLRALKDVENESQVMEERKKAADLQAISDAWEVFSTSRGYLRQNWAENEEQWRLEGERREGAPGRRPRVGHFQFVVVPVMLLCWIAQWLFWSGYVGVAGDKYNPQKLALVWFIWTVFSGIGVTIGVSF